MRAAGICAFVASLGILVDALGARQNPELGPTITVPKLHGLLNGQKRNGIDYEGRNVMSERDSKDLQPRATKEFSPCGASGFSSNQFASWPQQLALNPHIHAYGWVHDDVNNIHNLTWVSQTDTPEYQQAVRAGRVFNTEHDLEWQTVGRFFDWVAEELKTRLWPDPNPRHLGQSIKFRQYFKAQWTGRTGFILNNHYTAPRTPFQYIADQYPSTQYQAAELVGLESRLNGMKSRIFKSNPEQIYDSTRMVTLIQSNPLEALLRVRRALGLAKYLQQTRGIFATQALRIRNVIDELDRGLHLHRKVEGGQMFDPWQHVGLAALYDDYMDEVWRGATKELSEFIEHNFDGLRGKYCMQKDLAKYRANQQNFRNEIVLCNALHALTTAYQQCRGVQRRPW